jgi:hypothetical protein
MSLFETDPVSRNCGLIEEPRLRAVPVDEFANGVIVRPLGTLRLFRTANFDSSRSGSFKTVFGLRFRLIWPFQQLAPQLAFDAFRRMLGCFSFLIPFVIVGRQLSSSQTAIRSGDN